jgi:hypothetical protein
MRSVKLRQLLVVLGLFAAGATGATGCGQETAPGGDEVGDRTPTATNRARQVSDAWAGSEAARLWRQGYFPLDESVQLPEGGFRDKADERAYVTQNFALRGSLPKSPPQKGEVRWRSGGSLTVPVTAVQTAYEKLARGSNSGPRLTVTGARLGEMTVFTSRGQATVPAWHFTLDGYDTPLKRVAVSPSKLPRPPIKAKSLQEASDALWPLAGLTTMSQDDRTVGLVAHHGSCDDGPSVDVLETEDNVVLSASIRNRSDGPCTDDLHMKKVTVKLDRPVGDRMLLDAFTGRPVPYAADPGSLSPTWS